MSGVTFERLPPERRVTAPSAASAGACCCCCCCCLHTIGSVVGALTAKAPERPATEVPPAAAGTVLGEPTYVVTKEYWGAVLVLSLVGFPLFVYLFVDRELVHIELGVWGILYLLGFPIIQLAASVVVAFRTTCSHRPGREERLRHLGSITARAFVGAMIGIFIMIPLFALL